MKIWLAVVLLTAVALSAAAVDEVVRVPTGTDEDAAPTKPTLLMTNGEKTEREKDKSEKRKDEEEHDDEENEENENEEDENEEEDESDQEESDEEDSEESEEKGISKKKAVKDESEEENNNNEKSDVFKVPSVVPPRPRPSDSSVTIQPYKSVDASRSGHRTFHPENSFSSAKFFNGNTEVHRPNVDVVEISTAKPFVQFPIRSRPLDSVKRLDDAVPVFRSTEFHQTEESKAHHPKWFFNTQKAKSSDDSPTKKEISKPFVPEIPMSKAAFVLVPAWPTTNSKLAVRESFKPAVSQSDHRNSPPKWFFNSTPKSRDGFNKNESWQDIYNAKSKSAAAEARPWSESVISSPAPPTFGLPIYGAIDSSQPSTRKAYPSFYSANQSGQPNEISDSFQDFMSQVDELDNLEEFQMDLNTMGVVPAGMTHFKS